MSVTMVLRPAYPLFIGGVKELRPTTAPLSRHIPPIYTAGGAVLALLLQNGFYAEELEKLILGGELRIFGTYMRVKDRYYVPSPSLLVREETGRKQRKLAMVMEEPWAEGLFKRCGIKVPFDPSVKVKDESESVLVPVDRLPDVDVEDVCAYKVESGEKLGIAVDRFKRVTLRPYLYTRVDVEAVGTEEGGQLAFCVDVEAPEDAVKALKQTRKLIRFGGEGSVALASPEDDALLAKKVARKPEAGRAYMAVSHVRVEPVGKEFAVRLGGEVFTVEWCVGRVEPLSGWLLRENRPKKTVATLAPGTVFKLGSSREPAQPDQPDEWYFNLLNTIVEIRAS